MAIAPDRQAFAHLLRRAGFGPTPAEVDAAVARGYEATVAGLLDFTGPDPVDASPLPSVTPFESRSAAQADRQTLRQRLTEETLAIQVWWLQRMAASAHPLREKLTLFWHGHFATSIAKVRFPALMLRQNQLLRSAGAASFEALTQAVAKDPAMMIWLDTSSDKLAHPNENFARELMELFTLGLGSYTEDDVREAARAFTGWVLNPATVAWAMQRRQHDAGSKTVLGTSGNLGGEEVVHIVTNSPAGHAFIVASVWSHFAYPVATSDPVVADLVPGYASDLNITNLLRAVFLHPQFGSAAARTGLVKQPVEWAIGALRAFAISPASLTTQQAARLVGGLTQLGQTLFRPPNVGGWPQNDYWLTTASSMARYTFASAITARADVAAIAGGGVDALANLLGVEWSAATRAALAQAANPHQLAILGLVAPEYVLA